MRKLILAVLFSLSAFFTYAQAQAPQNFMLISVFPTGAFVTLTQGNCQHEVIKDLISKIIGEDEVKFFAPGSVKMGERMISVCWALSEEDEIVIIDENGQGGSYPVQIFSMVTKQ